MTIPRMEASRTATVYIFILHFVFAHVQEEDMEAGTMKNTFYTVVSETKKHTPISRVLIGDSNNPIFKK